MGIYLRKKIGEKMSITLRELNERALHRDNLHHFIINIFMCFRTDENFRRSVSQCAG